MEFDITKIIEALITLIIACITTFLIPYIRSKTSKETQEEILKWITIAVSAAEQIYLGSGRGEEKKQYVINWLKEHKINYDSTKIDAIIEATVYELNRNQGILVNGTLDTTTEIE